jgi:hypothetical protein
MIWNFFLGCNFGRNFLMNPEGVRPSAPEMSGLAACPGARPLQGTSPRTRLLFEFLQLSCDLVFEF